MNCSLDAAYCHKGCGARKHRFAGISLLLLFTNMATALALDLPEAVKISKAYLDSGDQKKREVLAKRLAGFTGDIDRCIVLLRPRHSKEYRNGFSGRERFTAPEFKEKYAADHLYYFVPDSYDPAKPTGLFIFMHGGGTGTPPEAAEAAFSYYIASSNYLKTVPFIGVAPSAPPDEKNSRKSGPAST